VQFRRAGNFKITLLAPKPPSTAGTASTPVAENPRSRQDVSVDGKKMPASVDAPTKIIRLTLLQPCLYNYISLLMIYRLRRKVTTVSKPPLSLLWCNCLETGIDEILFRKRAIYEVVVISTEVGFH